MTTDPALAAAYVLLWASLGAIVLALLAYVLTERERRAIQADAERLSAALAAAMVESQLPSRAAVAEAEALAASVEVVER